MKTVRDVLLIFAAFAAIILLCRVAADIRRIEVAATNAFATVQPTVAKLDANVQRVSSGVGTLGERLTSAANTLDADVHGATEKLDGIVGHIDAAVDRAGESFNKAVGEAINPLPAVPGAPAALSSLFRPTAKPSPTPSRP